MRSAKDIKKLIRKINVTPAGQADQKTLVDILLAQEEAKKTCSADIRPSIGRIIMKSKMTKFAAAAVIIMALLIGVNWFGGSVDVATIAFAEISEAMKKVPWMHQVSTGCERGISGTGEQWVGFERGIFASKSADGKVTFINMKEHKSCSYDPKEQTITINYIEDNFPLNLSSPASMLESMSKALEKQGAQIITKEGEYNGQKVQLQEISLASVGENNESMTMRLYIEPDSKLLFAAKVKGTGAEGKVIMDGEVTFSYPDTGPLSIYDLGVPQDTKLISNVPSKDYQQIWDSYCQARLNSTKEYTAVITHMYTPLDRAINMVDVDYKLNRKHRLERHFVFKTGDQCDRCWPSYNEKLGSSFESLLAWTEAHYKETGHISVYLYDGEYNISITRDDQGVWDKPQKHYSPDFESLSNFGLADIGWPGIGSTGQIIEDEYSVNNELICIERLQQGIIDSRNVSLPARFLYYLDPRKNYMCVREVTEWCPDADWQRDKNWLDGVEIEKVRDGSITIEDIIETAQAENGLWYPKCVEEKQTGIRKDYKNVPLHTSVVKKIYVETNRTFPEDVFDIAGLSVAAKIVDNSFPDNVDEILKKYEGYRKTEPLRYASIAINGGGAEIMFKDGEFTRTEKRFAKNKSDWEKQSKDLVSNFESLLNWWMNNDNGERWDAVYIYDGKIDYFYSPTGKVYRVVGHNTSHRTLNDYGWPSIRIQSGAGRELHIIETDYSKESGLICIELLEQSEILEGGDVLPPARRLYYLAPGKGYMCVRYEYHCIRDASWQKDKTRLAKIDSSKFPSDYYTIDEVTETSYGSYWYPKKIKKIYCDTVHIGGKEQISYRDIYLNTNPVFPEGIFDVAGLSR